ncbi:MAG: TRAP transporter large permease [Treponema sp.]|nr:TRAP transporter large permease [Treponema sp.]
MGLVITAVFIGTMLLGMPIAVCLGITAIVGFLTLGMPMSFVAQTAFTAVDDFTTIAIPMFMLAGAFMERGGLTHRLINLAKAIVGQKAGGLALVTIVACTLFGAIAGSAVATAAAVGTLLIPAMIREGYKKEFAGAVTACAGGVGAVIPPSILMIIFGVSAEVSITALFVAGVIPGLLIAAHLAVAAIWKSRHMVKPDAPKTSAKAIGKAAWDAKWALFMPVIVLGGIYGGVFTVTEASVAAVIYSFFVVTFIYREMNWKVLIGSFSFAARTAGMVLLIITTGRMFGRMITLYHVPQIISEFLVYNITNPTLMILFVLLVFLIVGMWMEASTLIIILTPLLLPVMESIGISPIQFGIMFIMACNIGFQTPPVGVNLFIVSDLAGTSVEKITVQTLPFTAVEIVALLLVSFIPSISLFLPRLMGFAV